jgi:hypothetical protein
MRTWMADSSLLSCESAAALSVLSAAALMAESLVAAVEDAATTLIFEDASVPAVSWGDALKELPICTVFMILSALQNKFAFQEKNIPAH